MAWISIAVLAGVWWFLDLCEKAPVVTDARFRDLTQHRYRSMERPGCQP